MKRLSSFTCLSLLLTLTLWCPEPLHAGAPPPRFSLQNSSPVPGSVDSLDATISGTYVYTAAQQPDGKTIIGGFFSSVLGEQRIHIARLNADDSLDQGFNPSVNGFIYCAAVLADGKILIGGDFNSPRDRLARLHPDGSLDTTFEVGVNGPVYNIVEQPDGKILLGGFFTQLQPDSATIPTARHNLARIDPDGAIDELFDPSPSNAVYGLALQADGKILLTGSFNTLRPNEALTPTTRNRVARLHPDGSLDLDFDPNVDLVVTCVAVQADAKILLGGFFSTLQPNGAASPTPRNCLARLHPDGTLDTGFDPKPDNFVFSMALQANGQILLGGDFTKLQPNGATSLTTRNRVARLHPDGSLDTGFDPAANDSVRSLTVQADGRILLGGEFTSVGGVTRHRFARLNNDPATESFTALNSTHVRWTRGGTAPNFSRVTFDRSIDGGTTWLPLGEGARIGTSADWQLSGFNLKGSGQLRARGRLASGTGNGSYGLLESLITYSDLPGPITLTITRLADTVKITWPIADSGGLFLQSASVLGPVANWEFAELEPQEVDDLYQVILPLETTERFFRLKQSIGK
ncbi:MAG: delta-60 repeat domain-containing protein [Verrucomicrobiota bacterium]